MMKLDNYLTPEEIGMYKEYKNSDDFGLILNCAVRYAMGRMTYVPRSVINYIIPIIQDIDNRTLDCFIRDIELYDEDVNRGIGSWGADFDKADWMRFLEVCRKENERRKNEDKRH